MVDRVERTLITVTGCSLPHLIQYYHQDSSYWSVGGTRDNYSPRGHTFSSPFLFLQPQTFARLIGFFLLLL
jgi:hypothetical protein